MNVLSIICDHNPPETLIDYTSNGILEPFITSTLLPELWEGSPKSLSDLIRFRQSNTGDVSVRFKLVETKRRISKVQKIKISWYLTPQWVCMSRVKNRTMKWHELLLQTELATVISSKQQPDKESTHCRNMSNIISRNVSAKLSI